MSVTAISGLYDEPIRVRRLFDEAGRNADLVAPHNPEAISKKRFRDREVVVVDRSNLPDSVTDQALFAYVFGVTPHGGKVEGDTLTRWTQ